MYSKIYGIILSTGVGILENWKANFIEKGTEFVLL